MDNKKYVWLVMTDWSIPSGEHTSDAYVYSSYEAAKKSFERCVRDDKLCFYEGYDSELTSYSWEEEEDYWCIWKSGYYSIDHSEIKIEKRIIEDYNVKQED